MNAFKWGWEVRARATLPGWAARLNAFKWVANPGFDSPMRLRWVVPLSVLRWRGDCGGRRLGGIRRVEHSNLFTRDLIQRSGTRVPGRLGHLNAFKCGV